jgi:hypothetical protein
VFPAKARPLVTTSQAKDEAEQHAGRDSAVQYQENTAERTEAERAPRQ